MSHLQDLYYGSLCPQADNQGITRRWEHFLGYLKEQAPELEQKFSSLMDDTLCAYIADTENMFCQGYSLAVKLLAEALSLPS